VSGKVRRQQLAQTDSLYSVETAVDFGTAPVIHRPVIDAAHLIGVTKPKPARALIGLTVSRQEL
jgi:hypothetical protein